MEQYERVKRFLFVMLRDLHFQATPAGEHTLSAIPYLAELSGSKKRIRADAPEHNISGPWKRLVYDRERQCTFCQPTAVNATEPSIKPGCDAYMKAGIMVVTLQ